MIEELIHLRFILAREPLYRFMYGAMAYAMATTSAAVKEEASRMSIHTIFDEK